MNFSQTEENYLKAIFKIAEGSDAAVSTNAISAQINTTAASVTDMIRKLAEKGLVNYEKYKGVTLTREGEGIAKDLVRKHRLWEVFLVEKLNFNWDEVHDLAEELEHINSDILTNRLEEYLQNPKFDPHGDPIPDKKGNIAYLKQAPLSNLKTGHTCVVVGVKDTSAKFLKYLDSLKIGLGSTIKIIKKIEYDNSLMIDTDAAKGIAISGQVAANLYVRPA